MISCKDIQINENEEVIISINIFDYLHYSEHWCDIWTKIAHKLPISREIKFNEQEIESFVLDMKSEFDYGGFQKYFFNYYEGKKIASEIYKNKFFVWNKTSPFYLIAFSINFVRFDICCMQDHQELIKWFECDRDNDKCYIVTEGLLTNNKKKMYESLLDRLA